MIIQYLMAYSNISLFHTGGEVDQKNSSTVGLYPANFLSDFNMDIAFISTSSWDLVCGIPPIAAKVSIKQTLLNSNCETILVSDSSKYSEYSRFKICNLPDFFHIITDNSLSQKVQEGITALGVKLAVVDCDIDDKE